MSRSTMAYAIAKGIRLLVVDIPYDAIGGFIAELG